MVITKTKQQIIQLLESTRFATLATADQHGVVSTAQMCLINDGLIVLMQTDKNFVKVKNITQNPHVAFNIASHNFKGTAKTLGHPTSNPIFIEKMKSKHPSSYESYTNLANEVLIEIHLTEVRIWDHDKVDLVDLK